MTAAECCGAIHTPLTGKCKAIPGFRPLTGMYEQMREGTEAFYIVGKYGVYVSDKVCCLSRLFRWLKPSDSNPALLQVKRQELDFQAKR